MRTVLLICGLLFVPYLYTRAKAIADRRAIRRGYQGSMLEDWTLLGISLGLCAGAALGWRSNWRTSVVGLAFFGSGALLFGFRIWRKLQDRAFRAERVSILGGKNIAMGGTVIPYGIGLVVVGGLISSLGTTSPWLVRGCGALMVIAGAFLLVARATGLYRQQFLRFEPGGIVFGLRNCEFTVRWDEIRQLRSIEFAGNPMIVLELSQLDRIDVRPPGARQKFYRLVGQNALFGGHVSFMPGLFGMDVPPLMAALLRYRNEPSARQELDPPVPRAARPLLGR